MANRIDTTLAALRRAGKPALAPFITVGFPDAPTSEALAEAILDAGADLLELGIPFSDPLADGPTIQMTSFRALEQGVTLASSLDALRRLRGRGVDAPLIFMGYLNPLLRYGIERFAADAADAGLDGNHHPRFAARRSAAVSSGFGGARRLSHTAACAH